MRDQDAVMLMPMRLRLHEQTILKRSSHGTDLEHLECLCQDGGLLQCEAVSKSLTCNRIILATS